MFVSYKTPLKPFKTGLCQWEGLDFLWILVIVSIHDPTLDYSNRISKFGECRQYGVKVCLNTNSRRQQATPSPFRFAGSVQVK